MRKLVYCIRNKNRKELVKNRAYLAIGYKKFNEGYLFTLEGHSTFDYCCTRFKEIRLYPNTKLFQQLYPDHILYQGKLGVLSEIKL
jgi:hypothetical protein